MALEKVQITVKHTGERIAAMFNPEEYTLTRTITSPRNRCRA